MFLYCVLLSLLVSTTTQPTTYPLPVSYYIGIGYESLTNQPMLNVLNVTFDQHQIGPARNGYMPDHTNGYSHPYVNAEFYAKVEDWMSNTTETRTYDVSSKASLFGVSGSYSQSSTWTHRHLSNKNIRVAKVDATILTSTLVSQLENAKFTDGTRNQLKRIAYSIDKGTNVSYGRAVWETNQFLRFYGADVVYKIDSGGTLKLSVAVNINTWSDYTEEHMKKSAGVDFGKLFGMSGNYHYSYDKTAYQSYNSSVSDTHVETNGGTSWVEGSTYSDWSKTVPNDEAVVNVYTISILDMITPWRLPDLLPYQVQNLRDIFTVCIEKHITDNTHVGCMDPYASNYNFKANVHSESACMFNRSFAFGGVYQTSSNPSYAMVNEMTQDYTCPRGFTSHRVFKPTTLSHSWTDKKCHSCWAVARCCKKKPHSESTTVTPFMCIAPLTNESRFGAAFGGAYSDSQINDVTGRNACPTGFHKSVFPLSWDKSKYYAVCYAPFDTEAANDGVNFGGMFSTNTPNPDTNNYFCPEGFVRHSLHIQGDTYLYYCTGMNDPHQRRQYIPPGWGDPEPNFVDAFDIPNDNSTEYFLMTNISDKSSYIEQFNNVWNYANPPTHSPTHSPTTHSPTHGPTHHSTTHNTTTTRSPTTMAPTPGSKPQPNTGSNNDKSRGAAIAGWIFVVLLTVIVGLLLYDKYKKPIIPWPTTKNYNTITTFNNPL